jgi:hypothetical protein
MSTAAIRGISVEISKLEKKLERKNLSEWDRRWSEYKLVEAKFWLWAEVHGWEERRKECNHHG